MMKKIHLFFALFGLLTACSDRSDGHESGVEKITRGNRGKKKLEQGGF